MALTKFLQINFVFLLLFSKLIFAATSWDINHKKSSIKFSAIQNGAPVTGEFKEFNGNIIFDPNALATSHVSIEISMGSVTTSYKEVATTLKLPEWFDIKVFPKAFFAANKFQKFGSNNFEAFGILKIRNKAIPIILKFIYTPLSATEAKVDGTASISRTAFDVGQGEWKNTDSIKDDVKINFVIYATKK